MKKVIFFAIIALFGFSSCMWCGYFGKRPVFLVGAPDNIQVTHNGKKIDVKEQTMANFVTNQYSANVREKTKFRHPAALIKVRRNNKIELSSGAKTATINLKGKAGKGIVFLVLEAPITLGIGTIVDLATVSFYYPETKYLDVDAAFNNKTPSDKKTLYNIALQNSTKEVTTEVRTK